MTPSTTVINPRMRPATAIPLPTPPRLLAADMLTAPKIIARIARTQSKNGTHEKTMLMIPSTRAVTASPLPCGCATAPPYGYGCANGGRRRIAYGLVPPREVIRGARGFRLGFPLVGGDCVSFRTPV